jgi:hypothetical protein
MSSNIAIAPEQINTEQHFWDAFGNMETEISSSWIVLFCQERGQGWAPFTRAELEEFYHAKGRPESFHFNGLIRTDNRWLMCKDDSYTVTTAFVQACYSASPAI